MRIAQRGRARKANEVEQFVDPLRALLPPADPVDREGFGDDLADAHPRIERAEGILEDDLQVPAAGPQRGSAQRREVLTVVDGLARPWARSSRSSKSPGGRLSAAGFADEAKRLAPSDREVHSVDSSCRSPSRQEAAAGCENLARALWLRRGAKEPPWRSCHATRLHLKSGWLEARRPMILEELDGRRRRRRAGVASQGAAIGETAASPEFRGARNRRPRSTQGDRAARCSWESRQAGRGYTDAPARRRAGARVQFRPCGRRTGQAPGRRSRCDHAEIVGDEEHREGSLALQIAQKVEDLRLNGDVEGSGRLVGDEKLRFCRQRHRDHRPVGAFRRKARGGRTRDAGPPTGSRRAGKAERFPPRVVGRANRGADVSTSSTWAPTVMRGSERSSVPGRSLRGLGRAWIATPPA